MVEHAKGAGSRWGKYFESFPAQCDGVPILWPKQDWVLLEGTELDGAAPGELDSMREDFDELVAPVVARHPALHKLGITFQSFVCAATLVSSRAFYVDEEHGDAMVPLADIFNHRSAIIKLAEGCSIEGYDNEDVEVQSQHGNRKRRRVANADNADADADEQAPEDEKEEEEQVEGQYTQNDGNDFPLNIAICSIDDIFPDEEFPGGLEIVIQSPTAEGGEIWNTYGELSNGSLLMKYGFAARENPHDIANLDSDLIASVLAARNGDGGDVDAGRFREILEHEDLFEDSSVFEIGQDGSLPTSLLFGVHYAATQDGKMRRRYTVNVADAARNADPDLILKCPDTLDVLRCAICTRLAQLDAHNPQKQLRFEGGAPAIEVARKLHQSHADAFERASKRPARHCRRLNALALRLGESNALVAALATLF